MKFSLVPFRLNLTVVMLAILWLGCEESDDSTSSDTTQGQIQVDDEAVSGDIEFNAFEDGKEAGPVITGQLATGLVSSNCTMTNKETLTTIFQLIKDYDGSGDTQSQCVDGSNMYVAMSDAEFMVDLAYSGCTAIEDQSIDSIFDFGDDSIESNYECFYEAEDTSGSNEYFRSYALKEVDSELFGNFGHYHTEDSQNNPRALQFHYNQDEQQMTVNQAYLVNYTSGETYNVRIHFQGDLNSKLFTTKLWKGGTDTNGSVTSSISIAGYGLADDGHFLFKVCKSWGDAYDCGVVDNKYYCFESDVAASTIDGWADSEDDGKTSTEIASGDCADYLDEVNALTMYTEQDQADETSDFTGSGTGNYKLEVDM